MKVLEKGRTQKGWATETSCTGKGNGGGGCGAKLLVDESDLFQTSRQSYGDDSPEYFATFKCVECGVLTDIDNYPKRASSLPKQKLMACRCGGVGCYACAPPEHR